MSVIVDAHGIPWEEQSPGVFVMLGYLSKMKMATSSEDMDLLLDKQGRLFYRYLNRSRYFKMIVTPYNFIQIASDIGLTDEGNIYRINSQGHLNQLEIDNINWIGRSYLQTSYLGYLEATTRIESPELRTSEGLEEATAFGLEESEISEDRSDVEEPAEIIRHEVLGENVVLAVDINQRGNIIHLSSADSANIYPQDIEYHVHDDASKIVIVDNLIRGINSEGKIEGVDIDNIFYDLRGNSISITGIKGILTSRNLQRLNNTEAILPDDMPSSGDTINLPDVRRVLGDRNLVIISSVGTSMIYHDRSSPSIFVNSGAISGSFVENGSLLPTNIPPERFLPNLNPDSYKDTKLGAILLRLGDNLPKIITGKGYTVTRVISDRIALITWKKGIPQASRPLIQLNVKASYDPQDVSGLLCAGITLSLSLSGNTQLISQEVYDNLSRDINYRSIPAPYIDAEVMLAARLEALKNPDSMIYRIPKIPDNSIPIIYVADGMGRELVTSIYGDILDYRYTPMRTYPVVKVEGYLHGRDIYTNTVFYSISYYQRPLDYSQYNPSAEVNKNTGVIYVETDNVIIPIEGNSYVDGTIIYKSYTNLIHVYLHGGQVFGHDGSNLPIQADPSINGYVRGILEDGLLTQIEPDVSRLVLPMEVSQILSSFYNYPDPYNLSQAVINFIKINHRKAVHALFGRIKLKVYQEINNPILLDLGSGRGGDLRRWTYNYKRIVAVEPNPDNYSDLKIRVNNYYGSCAPKGICSQIRVVEAYAQDWLPISKAIGELLSPGQKIPGSVTVISMIDSLTFFGDKELPQLANTISQALNRKKGMFIFKVMDGESVIELLKEYGHLDSEGRATYSYGEFSITLLDRDRIEFSNQGIVGSGQIEYLFYPDKLRKALSKLRLNTRQYSKIVIPSTGIKEVDIINNLYRIGAWFTQSPQKSQSLKNIRGSQKTRSGGY